MQEKVLQFPYPQVDHVPLRKGQNASLMAEQRACSQIRDQYNWRGVDSWELMLFTVKGIVGKRQAAVQASIKLHACLNVDLYIHVFV